MGETAVTFNVTSHAVGQVTTYLLSNDTYLNRLVAAQTQQLIKDATLINCVGPLLYHPSMTVTIVLSAKYSK